MNKEDIVWLDGYLKGITALTNVSGRFTFNALLLKLIGTDVVQSYMDFINKNSEADSLGIEFSPLKLTKRKPVSNWPEVVANNVGSAFSGMKVESYQGAVSQTLDVLDMIVSESSVKQNFICSAEMGKSFGEYLFFQLTGDEYLVLSFLRE